MNRRQFILLLFALAVIGSAGLVIINRHKQSWNVREAKVGDKLLPNFRPNDVASIHIKSTVDLNIENKDGSWRVRERGDYASNYDRIKNLLVHIKDIKIVQSDDIGPSQRPRVELAEPGTGPGSGTLIEFKDPQGRVLDSMLVGKRHMRAESSSDPYRMRGLFDGCYVLLPKEPSNVLLISDQLASVSGQPGAWLNTDFVKIENPKAVSLAGADGTALWTLSRESLSKPWTLADAKPNETLDPTKAAQTVELLNYLSFIDLVPNTQPVTFLSPSEGERVGGTDKSIQLSVETFEHFSYLLKFINPSNHDGTYQMSFVVKAEIPKERVAASNEKPADKQKLDDEFQGSTKRLRYKLASESRFASNGWDYLIESRLIEPLLCKRADLLQKPAIAEAKAGQ